jgi:hypothetical protein
MSHASSPGCLWPGQAKSRVERELKGRYFLLGVRIPTAPRSMHIMYSSVFT